jgi:hypothetical protein
VFTREPAHLILGVSLVTALALTGCTSVEVEGTEPDDPPAAAGEGDSFFDTSDCEALIPAAVLDGLGWNASDEVAAHATRCELTADEGTLIVQDRALVDARIGVALAERLAVDAWDRAGPG